MVMMEELLRRIRGRIARKIFICLGMMRISHKNTGLAMFVMVAMSRGRRMKSGAKHREQNQELENDTPHGLHLAERCNGRKRSCLLPPAPA